MNKLRDNLIQACRKYLQDRIDVCKNAMRDLKEDLENESKSSAGDKYETGREMINIEWNKLTVQLNEYDRLAAILNRIENVDVSEKIILGAIVSTDNANYFISIPAGELKSQDKNFYAVGIKSPIAQKLLGKSAGDSYEINGKLQKVIEII